MEAANASPAVVAHDDDVDYIELRDEYAKQLGDRPEVESVALGKADGKIVLVVLIRRSAPENQRARWLGNLPSFRNVAVTAREWRGARFLE